VVTIQEESVRLSNTLIETVKKSGVKVFFANRRTTTVWNSTRLVGEPLRYGGWYWMRSQRGKVVAMDEDGPFRSQSAAIRDAFVKLQLRGTKVIAALSVAFLAIEFEVLTL
jgi:hypothetical protein